jgi:virginiamycin B lyase
MSGDRIGRFDPGTARFTQFRVPAPHALPYWLAIAPGGRVWFTEFGGSAVGVLRPATGRVREYRLPKGQDPAGIAIGPGGTPWVATIEGSLFQVEPAAGTLHRFRAPAASAYGVAVTPDGTVWLGTTSGHAVYSFDPATAGFRRHPLPGGGAPWWVVAGGTHQVWVSLGAEPGGALGKVTGSASARQ